MPRHLISDAHEWINEIPTVPIYYLAKPQPRERTWVDQRGKKTLNHTAKAHGVNSRNGTSCCNVCNLLCQPEPVILVFFLVKKKDHLGGDSSVVTLV